MHQGENVRNMMLAFRWGIPIFFAICGAIAGKLYPILIPSAQENIIEFIASIGGSVQYNAYGVVGGLIIYCGVILFGRTERPIHWARSLFMYSLLWFAFGYALRFFFPALSFFIFGSGISGGETAAKALIVTFLFVILHMTIVALPSFKGVLVTDESLFRYKVAPFVVLVFLVGGYFSYAA